MLTPDHKFDYQISERGQFLVVSFAGILSKVTIDKIEECQQDIVSRAARLVVLNFKDASRIEIGGIATLVRLQKAIRDRIGMVRVCSLKPEIRTALISTAAVRIEELTETLADALYSLKIVSQEKGKTTS